MTLSAKPILPTDHDARLAEETSRLLSVYVHSTKSPVIQLVDEKGKKKLMQIPSSALQLLVDALVEMGEGNAVMLTSIQAELTTQEAAELLNVSRPYVVKLLETGQLPYRKVGSKRRIFAKDVLQYKAEIENKRRRVLDILAQKSQELNLGYE